MGTVLKLVTGLLLLLVFLYAGYEFGQHSGRQEAQTQLIENYSFVREIAELASLEADGISTLKSTNLANDNSWTDALRKSLFEKTIQVSIPYSAKYGVDLADSSLTIVRKDSLVYIHLPQPKLLSYELRLDRMEISARKGFFLGQNDELYNEAEKKLYAQSRAQMEGNALYLAKSKERIIAILQQYFGVMHLRVACVFDTGVRIEKEN